MVPLSQLSCYFLLKDPSLPLYLWLNDWYYGLVTFKFITNFLDLVCMVYLLNTMVFDGPRAQRCATDMFQRLSH